MNHGHVVETSLGYYINPILSILVGVIFLHERLAPLQWASVGLAALAVLVLTFDYGRLPWIALVLATSFATYGVIKKQVNGGAVETLTVESALLTPVALGYLAYLQITGAPHLRPPRLGPLAAADRVRPGHRGPAVLRRGRHPAAAEYPRAAAVHRFTLQFLLGVLYFGEDMSVGRWVGFALVWLALVILTAHGISQPRRSRPAAEPVTEPV